MISPGPIAELASAVPRGFCLPPDATVEVQGGTLHGALSYNLDGDVPYLAVVCYMLPDHEHDLGGYVQAGPDRFHTGHKEGDTWVWTNPVR